MKQDLQKFCYNTFLTCFFDLKYVLTKIDKSILERFYKIQPEKSRKPRETRGSVSGRGGLDLIGLGVSIGRGPEGP